VPIVREPAKELQGVAGNLELGLRQTSEKGPQPHQVELARQIRRLRQGPPGIDMIPDHPQA
jgi:hypothetical protein